MRFSASLVDYYTVFKLKRMNRSMVRLYSLCFVHSRYQRLNDHLISAFCVLIRRYVDEVNERARDAYYLHRRQANEDIYQGAKLLYLFIDPALIAPPFAFLDCGVKNYARIIRQMAYLADFVLTRVRLSS